MESSKWGFEPKQRNAPFGFLKDSPGLCHHLPWLWLRDTGRNTVFQRKHWNGQKCTLLIQKLDLWEARSGIWFLCLALPKWYDTKSSFLFFLQCLLFILLKLMSHTVKCSNLNLPFHEFLHMYMPLSLPHLLVCSVVTPDAILTLPGFWISYKWNHTPCLLSPTSFVQHYIFGITHIFALKHGSFPLRYSITLCEFASIY